MSNIPVVKAGIVAVSRDCFPESLSVNRRKALVEAYTKKYDAADIYECPVCIVESEIHMVQALEDIKKEGCNALVVYLGNFGPEISETLLAKHFDGPVMFVAAAEETGKDLVQGRGGYPHARKFARRRILRHAECQLQPEASRRKGLHSGVSCGNGGRVRRHDS